MDIEATLSNGNGLVKAVEVYVLYDSDELSVSELDCSISPRLPAAFEFFADVFFGDLYVWIDDEDDEVGASIISDGPLFTCTFTISESATPGVKVLESDDSTAYDIEYDELPTLEVNGAIIVDAQTASPTRTRTGTRTRTPTRTRTRTPTPTATPEGCRIRGGFLLQRQDAQAISIEPATCPLDILPPDIACEQTRFGNLSADDPDEFDDGTSSDIYAFTLELPTKLTFSVDAGGFAPFIWVGEPDAVFPVFSGPSPLTMNPLPEGDYIVIVNNPVPEPAGAQPYTLDMSCVKCKLRAFDPAAHGGRADLGNIPTVPITCGETRPGLLRDGDPDLFCDDTFADVFAFSLEETTWVELAVTPGDRPFNPFLWVGIADQVTPVFGGTAPGGFLPRGSYIVIVNNHGPGQGQPLGYILEMTCRQITPTHTPTATATHTRTATLTPPATSTPASTDTATQTATATITNTPVRPPIVADIDVVQAIGFRRTVRSWQNGQPAPGATGELPFTGKQLNLLVEDRETWVRVYVLNQNASSMTIEATLKGTRDGRSLSSLAAKSQSARSGFRIDRANPAVDYTVYHFQLPSDWLSGTVEIEVELDPTQDPFGRDHATLNFHKRDLHVGFVLFDPVGGVAGGADSVLRQLYPANVRYAPYTGIVQPLQPGVCIGGTNVGSLCANHGTCPGGTCFQAGRQAMLATLDAVLRTSPGPGRPDALIGWTAPPPPPGNQCAGEAYRGRTTGTVNDPTRGDWNKTIRGMVVVHTAAAQCAAHGLAHEIGHLYSIEHPHNNRRQPWGCTGCPQEPSPWRPSHLAPPPYLEDLLIAGLNVRQRGGAARTDFSLMWQTGLGISGAHAWSPVVRSSRNIWITQASWEWLFNKLATPGVPIRFGDAVSGPSLLVRGFVLNNGTAVFAAAFPVPSSAPASDDGDYCLELEDAGGRMLVRHCFPASGSDEEEDPPEVTAFVETVPRPPELARVKLLDGNDVLVEQVVSTNPPVVEIISPEPDELWDGTNAVQWTAHDDDGDALHYMVQYSRDDRQSWLTLALDVTEPELVVNTEEIAGGDAVWLRVVASDGLNTAADEVGPIEVARKAPVVLVTVPEAGAVFPAGELVVLQATGYDPEDGGFGSQDFSWSSDRDGALGTGSIVAVDTLSVGDHRITVSSEDSDGNPGTASVDMRIEVSCAGDCDSDGRVSISELVTGVNTALGIMPVGNCLAFDVNGDAAVAINELIIAVNNALSGCGMAVE